MNNTTNQYHNHQNNTTKKSYTLNDNKKKHITIPIWKKSNLTLREAAQYFGIGISKIKELSEEDTCNFVLWVGSRRMIKRKAFEKFLNDQYSI